MFKDYVLLSELCKKAGVTRNSFYCHSQKKHFIEKMGGTAVIKISNLTDKYKKASKLCTNLEKYWSYSFLCEFLGMQKNYLFIMEIQRKIKFKYKKNKWP